MAEQRILECIPNVSEGRDKEVIKALGEIISSVDGVKLMHTDTGKAANRTVFTFAGEPENVIEAAFRLYKASLELIDMSMHEGIHPRQGAVDVCPLVPLKGITMDEAVIYARELSHRVGNELGIPGYFYEYNTRDGNPSNLAILRKGQYESLPGKFKNHPPDFGDADKWKKSGATVIGARKLLIAYNVNLNTKDISSAKKIAERLRESGGWSISNKGERVKTPGRLRSVKAIGWYIEDFQRAQVSFNLTDIEQAGILDVFLACKDEARKIGLKITGSELIGLAPLSEFQKVNRFIKGKDLTEENLATDLLTVVKFLGLDQLKPFNPWLKIIDLNLNT